MKQLFLALMIFTAAFLAACTKEDSFQIRTAAAEEEAVPDPGDPENEEEHPIAVYICGEVRCPGVYYLPEGSRIADLLDAAQGALPNADLNKVNLAQRLIDGQQVILYAATDTGGGNETVSSSGRININFADKEQLMTLPGIGEARAEAILKYREEAGWFTSTEDLMNISGIKEKMFEKIADLIEV